MLLNKLNKSKWGGAIFAKVGLERLDLLNENNYSVLEWMIPAPGQGIIGIASMKKNEKIAGIIKKLNCKETMLCAEIERNFLRTVQAGCSAPVGAYAADCLCGTRCAPQQRPVGIRRHHEASGGIKTGRASLDPVRHNGHLLV